MSTQLRGNRAVVTEVYEDVRGLVEARARRFAHRYRRDPDDAVADANLIFVELYHSHDPARSDLRQRLAYKIPLMLAEPVRQDNDRNAGLPRVAFNDATVGAAPAPPPFDREGFESELTDDARVVLGLLLETPADLLAAMRSARVPGPGSIRDCLRRYLSDTLGWAWNRVAESFEEIREALS